MSTKEIEASAYRRLAEFFHSCYLCDDDKAIRRTVNGAVVRRYREGRKLAGVSPGTVKRELALASRAVIFARREWNYEVENPFEGRLISDKDRKAERPREWHLLSPIEEKRLLLAARPLLRDIIIVALNTGMRQSEILGLTWDRTAADTVCFTPETQKSNRHGVRVLNDAALEAIARHPQCGEYVLQEHGQRLRRDWFFKRLWKPAREKAGLPHLRFHDLRKVAGQRLLDATGDIVAVQYQLGHSDLRTTQRIYTREPTDRLRAAVAKL